ncbi:MAG: divalent-cation tolerance protein CutA [Candidatus Pelagibacter sp. TMED273]|nr:MAG: divalent-cation tolerance protein CutA [Candidatus Pelagibacter sp. TMED273]|tara:strand:+ start:11539 stop:11850 length:312 start_codon:yes stop_codon:yes gene_type:complete
MTSFFYITSKNLFEAKTIMKSLLKKKLVACVNIYKNTDSYFLWKNKIQNSNEIIIMGKTLKKNESKIISEVKKNHSYDTPCVIFSKITNGNKDFLSWIKKSVK